MSVGGQQTPVVLGERLLRCSLNWACLLKAPCVGKWLWLCGLGHLSIENGAVVMEMGKAVPTNDLGPARILSKHKFKDLVLPPT